jgi:hypothetical protein
MSLKDSFRAPAWQQQVTIPPDRMTRCEALDPAGTYSLHELSEASGIEYRTLREHCQQGKLVAQKDTCNRWIARGSDFQAYARARAA